MDAKCSHPVPIQPRSDDPSGSDPTRCKPTRNALLGLAQILARSAARETSRCAGATSAEFGPDSSDGAVDGRDNGVGDA